MEDRCKWIDNIRGIAILLVMYGHVQMSDSSITRYMTIFNVQVFLIISGYLYAKYNKQKNSLKKTFWKIFIPYVSFSCIAIIVDVLYNFFIKENALKVLFIDCYKVLTLYGTHSMWYLPSYFFATVMFVCIKDKFKSNRANFLFIILALAISIIFSNYNNLLSTILPKYVYIIMYYPICTIVRSCACMCLIFFGYYIFNSKIIDNLKNYSKLILGIVLELVTYFLTIYAGNCNFSIVNYGSNPICFWLGSCFGPLGLFLIGSIQDKSIKLLQYCGKNSLILLITHSTLKLTNLSQKIVGIFISTNSYFFGIFCTIFMLLFEFIIIYLLNNKLSILLGSKKYKRLPSENIIKRSVK